MRNIFPQKILIVASFLLALGFIVDGSWIHIKAATAQVLIASAWNKSKSSGNSIKPWSWADTWPVARLRSSKHGIDLYVLDGSHGQALAFGPGRLNTPLGQSHSATVIAGHRDTHFRFLEHLTTDDEIELIGPQGDTTYYQVTSINIEDSRMSQLVPEDSGLTLVTCYPFTAVTSEGPLRYVVRATSVKNSRHQRQLAINVD